MYDGIRHPSIVCGCGERKPENALACRECHDDLQYLISHGRYNQFEFTKAEFIEYTQNESFNPVGTCAICGRRYIWGGHNPWPVVKDKDVNCCTQCNFTVVLPARIREISMRFAQQEAGS